MTDYMTKYGYAPDMELIDRRISAIAGNLESAATPAVLKKCFSMMDVTSLKNNDTPKSILKLVGKVNDFNVLYSDFPNPASICVYSNFAGIVRRALTAEGVHVTCVSACFPTSQSFLNVKLLECKMVVEEGADEIDIVLALNSFLAGDYDTASKEIKAVRETVDKAASAQNRKVILKVILETGLLIKPELIADASFLAMEAGADFIKTSTGKVDVNATPMAAFIMCECIDCYYKKTGKKVGFKPAGGISSALDAVSYYSIVDIVLGKDWLTPELFRFGVSRMANNILSTVEQKTVQYF